MSKFEEIKAYVRIFFGALMSGQFKYSFIILHTVIFGKQVEKQRRPQCKN